jgi:hypothetical protein
VDIRINVSGDLRRVTRSLGQLAEKQIPFATATGLNDLGKMVKVAEVAEVKKELPTSKPFTLNSVRQVRANKGRQQTEIYLGDIAAKYLGPYITRGRHYLNSRALLNPKTVDLDQYGNIPRRKLAALKASKDVFFGTIHFKNGTSISGVWMRGKVAAGPPASAHGKKKVMPAVVAQRSKLTLLVRFGDALPVRQHIDWEGTAQRIVTANFNRVFGRAMAKAIATARL